MLIGANEFLVGQPLQLHQPALRRDQLVAQVGDLIDQVAERGAYLRRQFLLRQAQQADRIVRLRVHRVANHGNRATHLAAERAQERQEFLVADLHVTNRQRTAVHAAMVSPQDVSAAELAGWRLRKPDWHRSWPIFNF